MILGKAFGIFLFSFVVIKFKISVLPNKAPFKRVWGISILGGLEFTMSLFINSLAFTGQTLIDAAKMGVLTGSIVAWILGCLVLR